MERTDIIVTAIIVATVVILHKIDKAYEKISDREGWYMYDQKTHKRIYY